MSHPMLMAVLIATPITSTVAQTDQTFDSLVVLFGNLHSHSTLSGDVHTDSLMRPMDGWRIADSAGLDFLGSCRSEVDSSRRLPQLHHPPHERAVLRRRGCDGLPDGRDLR